MNYAECTTTEAKEAAIAGAETVEELEEMWACWEGCGWSKDGLMYARVLARKGEIAGGLSEAEEEIVELARLKAKRGRELPPIKGRMAT